MISFGWLVNTSALWGLGIKITALLAIAAAIAAFARRQPAAARHFVWQLALGSVLVLTFVTPWAPPRTIALKAGPNEIHWLQRTGMPSAWVANSPVPQRKPAESSRPPESGISRSARADGRAAAVASILGLVWLLGCLSVIARSVITTRYCVARTLSTRAAKSPLGPVPSSYSTVAPWLSVRKPSPVIDE